MAKAVCVCVCVCVCVYVFGDTQSISKITQSFVSPGPNSLGHRAARFVGKEPHGV